MQTHIPKEFEELIADRLASGKYQSAEEVIRRAFRLWQEQEEKEEALSNALQIGIDQLNRGDALQIDSLEEHNAFFSRLKTDVMNRLENEKGQS